MTQKIQHFQFFKEDISGIELPEKFTFPFYYEPHPLAVIAAKELQEYLEHQTDFDHDFGLDENPKKTARGKMFGVLVVENQKNEIGYLAAFSGSFADKSLPEKFVRENAFLATTLSSFTRVETRHFICVVCKRFT